MAAAAQQCDAEARRLEGVREEQERAATQMEARQTEQVCGHLNLLKVASGMILLVFYHYVVWFFACAFT